MTTRMSLESYRALIEQVRACISLHVPRGSVVLIASKGDEELLHIQGYRAWHFPQNLAGVYAGHHPANSAEAIAHLRRLQSRGAQYLAIPWTARWWLEHYGELATHLNTVHELTVSTDGVCVVYELREAAVSVTMQTSGPSVSGFARTARDSVIAVVSGATTSCCSSIAGIFPPTMPGVCRLPASADGAEAIDRLRSWWRARNLLFLPSARSARARSGVQHTEIGYCTRR